MARIKYYYDTEKCKYERVQRKASEVVMSVLVFIAVSLVFALGLVFLYNRFFPSPNERLLRNENKELLEQYDILTEDMKTMTVMLSSLQERDAKIYRMVTGADSLPSHLRNMGTGGAVKHQSILDKGLDCSKLIADKLAYVETLKKKMYVQTKSYDEVISVAKRKEEMLASIPAIQPVKNKELKKLASGYGMRTHPIYKVKKMHWGVDFAAPKGTPVYATGDAVVEFTESVYSGYGNHIQLNHGFGYRTLYAHLQKIVVKKGQKVKRGELIGYIGNTGTSTAPHLHYEVINGGKKVNPVHYFFNDLAPGQYEEILEIASMENQSLS